MATVTVLPTAVDVGDESAPADPPRQLGSPRAVGRRRVRPGPRPVACGRSYETDMHGARLTTRGRVVVAALWLVMIAMMVAMVARPADIPAPAETTTVTVRSGDTLWGIAEGLVPGADRRDTVASIIALNGLSNPGDIQPGDVLVVPAGG